jgi:ketosteroid isomerase-like protein
MEAMTEEEALAFADTWAAHWNNVDVDAVVAHFAEESEMRSPLAAKLTGKPNVVGREAIRQYWNTAYAAVVSPQLELESASWDGRLGRLTVWWRADLPTGITRASESMDFGPDGLITRSEAYYGARI